MRALRKQTVVLQDRESLRTKTRLENFQGHVNSARFLVNTYGIIFETPLLFKFSGKVFYWVYYLKFLEKPEKKLTFWSTAATTMCHRKIEKIFKCI
jgi:hypothetical protein